MTHSTHWTVSRSTVFHTGSTKAWTHLQMKLSPEDRELLVKLSHARGQTASDVIRGLIRGAFPPATPPKSEGAT